eukprot:TRINITY_DN1766_c0_g1_i1.p1 TRINITY_DN1766_c0_g1~~TRINITY_DN1766_c0_g1_i1.p1  ORF type:complete len:5290 (-),score=625.38 TRINITY_DN1766_c0_g1_i1:1714-17583(-)
MEQLFAVRVLVHYHDKPKVDHDAVRRLLSAAGVESLPLLCTDGTTLKLSEYINTSSNNRKTVVEVLGSSGTSLVQVASVFMLAEARAASDSLCTSPGELEVTCAALERLLGFLPRTTSTVSSVDFRPSGKTRNGSNGNRRTMHRLSRSTLSDSTQVSILRAVNAILRLSDVATHCLAVVSRQALASKITCETAVNLSTRLLALASALCSFQQKDFKPSLSFFSSNSLRTTLVAGAMHLGAITMEHVTIDAMGWVQTANRILMNNGRTAFTPVSMLSALFGGMLSSAKRYEQTERETHSAEGAVCLLSTLHLILELEASRKPLDQVSSNLSTTSNNNRTRRSTEQKHATEASSSHGTLSQAARSFLGERVVAAEEDGDEGRIATGTVYHACEEYAKRSGEKEGIIGLLVRLFEASGRHFSQESADESVVSISEGTLPCPPDESDDCSDSPPVRQDSSLLSADQVDARSRDFFGTGITFGLTSEVFVEQNERIELHKEVAALALDTLGKWLEKAHSLGRYKDLDILRIASRICSSAGFFVFNSSSSSYDLRAAMVDFGSFIGPELRNHIDLNPVELRKCLIQRLMKTMTETCQRTNPVLSGITGSFQAEAVIHLWSLFESRGRQSEARTDRQDDTQGLSTDSILSLMLTVITELNAAKLMERIVAFLGAVTTTDDPSDISVNHVAASLILLSYSALIALGISEGLDVHRIAFAALYRRDADLAPEPSYPEVLPEKAEVGALPLRTAHVDASQIRRVWEIMEEVPRIVGMICAKCCSHVDKDLQTLSRTSISSTGTEYIQEASALQVVKQFFHLNWSFFMMARILHPLQAIHLAGKSSNSRMFEETCTFELLSPFVVEQASRNPQCFEVMKNIVRDKSSTIPVLFSLECVLLYNCTRPHTQIIQHAEWLLTTVLQTSLEIITDTIYNEPSDNFLRLLDAFQKSPEGDMKNTSVVCADRTSIFMNNSKDIPVCSALLQAMFYLRSLGTGRIPQVLASVFLSSSKFLEHLSVSQLESMRNLIIQVASYVFFVPRISAELAASMWVFIDSFLRRSFVAMSEQEDNTSIVMPFITRVCGFAKLAERDTISPRIIRAFCLFARDTALLDDLEEVLQFVSLQREIPERLGKGEVRVWLHAALPQVSLANLLSYLLVPADESAVAVSLHGESLAFLTEASQKSRVWRGVLLTGLKQMHEADPQVWEKMVKRSIVESATLNDGVLSIIEKVIGMDDSRLAAQLLQDLFRSACKVFDEAADVGLEGKCHILNFVVRLTICYGLVSARCVHDLSPTYLEPDMFRFLLGGLEKTSRCLLVSPGNNNLRHLVLFLCELLGCIEKGLSTLGEHATLVSPVTTESEKKPSGDGACESMISLLMRDASRPQKSRDSEARPLCTYTSTGSQFVEQHWYFCYTCELSGSEGVCSVCARVCHRHCEVAYSKFSRFFCDCGAGSDPRQESGSHGVASSEDVDGSNVHSQDPNAQRQQLSSSRPQKRKACQCLKTNDGTEIKRDGADEVINDDPQVPEVREDLLESELQEALTKELQLLSTDESSLRWKHRKGMEAAFRSALSDSIGTLIRTALYLTKELEGTHVVRECSGKWIPIADAHETVARIVDAKNFVGITVHDQSAASTKLLRPESFDTRRPTESSTTFCVSPVPRKSLIAHSSFERVIGVVEKSNSIEFIDATDDLFSDDGVAEKLVSRVYRKVSVPFDVQRIMFHPSNSNILLVTGKEKVCVFVRVGSGTSSSWTRMDVEVGLSEFIGYDGQNSLVDVTWIDEDATLLLVVTTDFVKIFDIAIDTFCPCFFARTPAKDMNNGDHQGKGERSTARPEKKRIVAASFARDHLDSWKEHFLVFVLTSDCNMFVTKSKRNQATSPVFELCFEAKDLSFEDSSVVNNMIHYAEESMFIVTFTSGNILCVPFSVKSDGDRLQAMVHDAHMFTSVFESGSVFDITEVQGAERTFLFYEEQNNMTCIGTLSFEDKKLVVKTSSNTATSSVLGFCSYNASAFVGEPSLAGGLLLLSDGSVHRLDVSSSRRRLQIPQHALISTITDRQRKRTMSTSCDQPSVRYGGTSIPPAVGFFEKCRLVSDSVRIERLSVDPKIAVDQDRMSVILAGSGSDCIVSPVENQPFRFTAVVENQALVLVGARMRFGGTDRSRQRVPAEVKVFNRTLRWNARNGVKRWLDIPFSISESMKSPHKVTFELFPRRVNREGRLKVDGLCAIDTLELYAVSNIEFTERKVLHEKAKIENQHAKKEKEDDVYEDLRNILVNTKEVSLNASSVPPGEMSDGENALLTVLNSIERQSFLSSSEAGLLLSEMNNMWSKVFLGPANYDQTFLDYMVLPCLTLCLPELMKPYSATTEISSPDVLEVFSSGTKSMLSKEVKSSYDNGIIPHFVHIEKGLFMTATLARSLFAVSVTLPEITAENWAKSYDNTMPKEEHLLLLMKAYLAMGRSGRLLCRTLEGVAINAVDAFMALSIRRTITTEMVKAVEATNIMVEMLCSFDQRLRLCTAQRLTELFDCLNCASWTSKTPFESVLTFSLVRLLKPDNERNDVRDERSGQEDSDGSEEPSRWAYRCDSCSEVCNQEWWHCADCEDFDLCTKCLRCSSSCVSQTHKDDHILLRGTIEQDVDGQTVNGAEQNEGTGIGKQAQGILSTLVTKILERVMAEESNNTHWRYLDAAEAISQLLGSGSPPVVKLCRLKALFTSSFPSLLCKLAESIGNDYHGAKIGNDGIITVTPKCADIFILMLSILLCASGSGMAYFVHKHNIPNTLSSLLEKMHPKLQQLAFHVSSNDTGATKRHPNLDIMSRSVWNKAQYGVPYQILSNRKSSRDETVSEVLAPGESLGSPNYTFINIMTEVMQVLEFSFRSAANKSILSQMKRFPRKVLCDVINFCDSCQSRHDPTLLKALAASSEKLLCVLSMDNTDELNDVLDRYLYHDQGKRLREVVMNKRHNRLSIPYESALEVALLLGNILKAARRHPETWRNYAVADEDIHNVLFEVAKVTTGELQSASLQLLAAAFSPSTEYASRVMKSKIVLSFEPVFKSQSDQELRAASFKLSPETEADTQQAERVLDDLLSKSISLTQVFSAAFTGNGYALVRFLLFDVMLRSHHKSSRLAAADVLTFVMVRAVSNAAVYGELIEELHKDLKKALALMPYGGSVSDGIMISMRLFVLCCQSGRFGSKSKKYLSSLITDVSTLLMQNCNQLNSHPNSRLYGKLSSVLDIGGYYLEADPCLTCAATTWESSEVLESRLEVIKAETKYTDCAIMHRLMTPNEIYSVRLKVIDPRRTRRAKKIEVYYSSRAVSDAAELKALSHPWKKLDFFNLNPRTTESGLGFLVPVQAANIKFEFSEFYDAVELQQTTVGAESEQNDVGSSSTTHEIRGNRVVETLQCPRCSRPVTDRHGICRNCHENAYQCRQCRNINYENLDGFLCNECGYCKHGRFEFSVLGKPAYIIEPVLNDDDRRRSSEVIERETANVHRCMEQLSKIRSTIIRSLATGSPDDHVKEKGKVTGNSRVPLGDIVPPRAELAMLEALLEGQVSQEVEETANSTQGGISITEDVIGDGNGSVEVHEREQSHQTGSNSGSPLNRARRAEPQSTAVVESSTVSKTTSALSSIYSKDCRAIYTSMSRGVRVLTMTRAELVRYANSIDENRLTHAFDLSLESEESFTDLADVISRTYGSVRRVQPCCYTCTQAFVANCVKLLGAIVDENPSGTTSEFSSQLVTHVLRVYSQCEKDEVRLDIRRLITSLVRNNELATKFVCEELARKISFCIESWETVDPHTVAQFDIGILESISQLDDDCWEERLRLVMTILFKASRKALTCSSVAESIILPCLQAALRILREDVGLAVQADDSSDGLALDATISSNGQAYGFQVNPKNVELQDTANHVDADSFPRGEQQIQEPEASRENDDARNSDDEDSCNNYENGDSNRGGPESDDDSQLCRNTPEAPTQGSSITMRVNTSTSGVHQASERVRSTVAPEATISVQQVRNVLEEMHEKGVVTADISDWLKGNSSQSTWFHSLIHRKVLPESKNGEELSQLEKERKLLLSCLRKWKDMALGVNVGQQSPLNVLSFEQNNWIVRLMLFTPCISVRKECCVLLKLLCNEEESLRLQLLDVLTGDSLNLATTVEEMSEQFFDLLENVLEPEGYRLYLISTGFLPRLTNLIRSMAERLVISEVESDSSTRLMSFMEGYSLKRLISVLSLFIEVIPSRQTDLRRKLFGGDENPIVSSLQRAYLCLRKLISMRTTLTEECGTRLCEILLSNRFLFFGPSILPVVYACVKELKAAKNRKDAQAIAILLEELCLMLCPERKEPTCMLSLNKAPTQEEFIRGNMARNPYISSSFDGPLMRDVKNKICRDLDLPGLLEDDFAMELLVAGNLIKLDLPIMGVYEHVWRGSAAAAMASSIQPTQLPRVMGLRRAAHSGNTRNAGGFSRIVWNRRRPLQDRNGELPSRQDDLAEPPMVIIYRLSGLDGEATEPIIDSLPSDSGHDNDEEEQFRDTIILGQVGGLDVLFELLSVVESWGGDAETAVRAPALRLLLASCQVAQNRATLAKSSNAVSTLLDCAASAFEHAQGSPAAVKSAESLLIAAEQILAQQRRDLESCTSNSQDSMHIALNSPEEVISRVRVFLGRLSLATSPTAENSILHLLPFLVQGNPNAVDLVLQHMWFDWDVIDSSDAEQKKARQLGTVLLAIPKDDRGSDFIAHTVRSGLAENAVLQIVRRFPIPRQERRTEWQRSLEGHGPPLILRLLTGMSFFLASDEDKINTDDDLRACFLRQEEIIPVLCQVEMAVSGNSVGSSAEELLEALSRDPLLKENIDKERESIKNARREAARLSRMSILREAGLSLVPTPQNAEAPTPNTDTKDSNGSSETSFLKLVEELPDENGPSCVVCGDGFQCRPEEALGLYVHCRRVSMDYLSGLEDGSGGSAGTERRPEEIHQETRLNWDVWANGSSRANSSAGSKTSGSSCFTTVTHMNAIHITCHKEAARMDRSSRRDEWDGASLRNSQTLCNNMFPVRPPASLKTEDDGEQPGTIKTAKLSYSAAVEGYFKRLSSLGRVSVPQSKALLYDLGRSFLRFADGRSAVFSEFSQGGGAHSNACFIPHIVQMAIYMIEVSAPVRKADPFHGNPTSQMMEEALSKYLIEGEQGDPTYYVALSLILHDIDQWNNAGVEFLRRCIRECPLPKPVLFRFFVFADLLNRVMKKDIQLGSDQHWLDGLRKHIGLDETFAQCCGDVINERWESYVRGITNGTQCLDGVRQNIEYGHEDRDSEKRFFKGVSDFISTLEAKQS